MSDKSLRLQLAQINPRVGDLEGNLGLARRAVDQAVADGADLVIFPELSVVGYPPKDLLEKRAFVAAAEAAAARWAKLSSPDTAVLFGAVAQVDSPSGKRLLNVAHLAVRGQVVATQAKTLLPSYDVFDEDRHFGSAEETRPMKWKGVRLGVSICEDIWNDKLFWEGRLYSTDPIESLCAQGVDVLINISASPFALGKPDVRRNMLAHTAKRFGKPLVYVNQVGGNDDVVYDGRSLVMDAEGRVCVELAAFEEDAGKAELSGLRPRKRPPERCESEDMRGALVLGLRDYARKCGFKSAVLGLSGGIDSALTAAIAAEALGPENVLGVSMPSRYSSEGSKTDARALADALGIRFRTVPIRPMFDAYLESLAPLFEGREEDVTEENLQARIRGAVLMAISNKFGHLLLTTGNKSEVAVGYCTLYGDTCGGLAVISDVLKLKVYALARWMNERAGRLIIPENSITKPASAELKPDQTDQDVLPPFEVLDEILTRYVEESQGHDRIVRETGFEEAVVRDVLRRVDLNEYKRKQLAPGLRVTKKAFGSGRIMPIAQGWSG
jgi:NAD+ synthetase